MTIHVHRADFIHILWSHILTSVQSLRREAADVITHAEIDASVKPLKESLPIIAKEFQLAKLKSKEKRHSEPHSPRRDTPHAAPLQIDLPQFKVHHLEWQHFETLFRAVIESHTSGYSELDKRCLLLKTLESQEARDIATRFASKNDTLEEVLKCLSQKFGRPQLVYPILVARVTQPDTYHDNYDEFQRLYNRVVGGFKTLLLQYTRQHFGADLSDEWDEHIAGKEGLSNIADLKEYLGHRLLHMTPHEIKEVAPLSSTSMTPATKQTKPPRPVTTSNCLACNEKHGLVRCVAFNGYDLDRRNQIVRDKRLCLNCFSPDHGFRACTSKFSCRTCGGCHHTLMTTFPKQFHTPFTT